MAIESVDGRRGIDSLAQLCREKLRSDPFSGCLFIFRNRSAKAIRLIAYDGQGFWLATKRLSHGRFRWWPTSTEAGKTLLAHQAQLLLHPIPPKAGATGAPAPPHPAKSGRDGGPGCWPQATRTRKPRRCGGR
ncbi:MAG: IS66 family insertion sequence element accessory protein TnpB [Terracidiphilus sp.]